MLTERLELRPFDRDEAEAVIAGARAGRRWALGFPRDDDRDVARIYLSLPEGADPTFALRLMVLRETGEIVGGLGFFGPPDEDGTVEFGYGIAPEFEGKGLTTEAVRGLLGLAAANAEVKTFKADTTKDNIGSQRVMEKVGMTRVSEDDLKVYYELPASALSAG